MAVVVQVVAADVAEVPVPEVVEVDRVVHPLLDHVGLQQAGYEHGRGLERRQPRDRREQRGEGQRVTDPPVDVLAVPRARVVLPVQRVEVLVREPAHRPPSLREPAVQHVPVDDVLQHRPRRHAAGEVPQRHEPL